MKTICRYSESLPKWGRGCSSLSKDISGRISACHPQWRNAPLGFTLIELLITVVVIGVLMALLLPAISRAKDGARAAKCTSNLRSLASAIHLQANESDGKWILVDELNAGYWFWTDALLQGGYLNSENSTFCPGWAPFSKFLPGKTYGVRWIGSPAKFPDDTGIIQQSMTGSYHVTYCAINLKGINNKSKYILMGDSYTTRPGNEQFYVLQGTGSLDDLHMRHSNRANVLFADGHVTASDAEDLRDAGWRFAYNLRGEMLDLSQQ